jgi:uncharacterized MAPEG superfamily protein
MTMSTEIQMLVWSIILGLFQLVLATVLATKDQGLPYNLSPRDVPPPPVTVITARVLRAFQNFRETFVYFAAAVIVLTMLGRASAISALGAQLYFWARVAYIPAYGAGIPVLRTGVWTVSIIGIVMVLGAIFA